MGSRHKLPENARIRVLSSSGSVTITAEDRSDVEVEPAGRMVELKEAAQPHKFGIFDHLHRRGRRDRGLRGSPDERSRAQQTPAVKSAWRSRPVLEIKSKSGSIEVRCPRGTDVSVGAISGQVKLIGAFGSVKVSTVSGSIEVDTTAGDVDARCVSGSITVKRCGGRCDVTSKSGRVRVDRVEGAARASTISGGVELGTSGGGQIELKMVSGGAKVKVLEPKHPNVRFHSLSGKMQCDCEQGSDFDLKVRSISGSLEVTGE
jgi:DUF4097 and DUF4098 domain-containing protein YvlB